MDEENEYTDEMAEEAEENDEINNSSDLEQKKRTTNEFIAEGNVAQTQIFIQNLSTLNADYKQRVEQNNSDLPEKSYDLQKSEDCAEFVEKYRNSEYLAMAIILSSFEVVTLGDLQDLCEKLMKHLPTIEILNKDGAEEHYSERNPYISLDTILTVIGGKRFVREDNQLCIGLGEGSWQALNNILEQFFMLKSPIVSWLFHVNETYKYRTTFDAYQIATAFARVVSLDIADAQRCIFQQLYANPDNAGLLGILVYKLYEDVALRHDVENIILQWIHSDSVWLWKSACLAYSALMEKYNGISFEVDLKKLISKKILNFKKDDLIFTAALLIQSKHFRTMFANVFNYVFSRANNREKRLELAQIYIKLVRRSYYLVNSFFMGLPLVACDTKQQQEYLAGIIEQTMSIYRLRKQLYVILKAYLKELSGYDCSVEIINHICAFFFNMAISDRAYQQDILEFLKNCKNKVARQIYDKLYHTYEKEGES